MPEERVVHLHTEQLPPPPPENPKGFLDWAETQIGKEFHQRDLVKKAKEEYHLLGKYDLQTDHSWDLAWGKLFRSIRQKEGRDLQKDVWCEKGDTWHMVRLCRRNSFNNDARKKLEHTADRNDLDRQAMKTPDSPLHIRLLLLIADILREQTEDRARLSAEVATINAKLEQMQGQLSQNAVVAEFIEKLKK